MKEPKRLLSHGASDFERQLLRAVASERPSALLRSRMQRSLGLVGPLAWASNVKAMFGSLSTRVSNSKVTIGAAAAGVAIAGGVLTYQFFPSATLDETPRGMAPVEAAPAEPVAAPEGVASAGVASPAANSSPPAMTPTAPVRAEAPAPPAAPTADDSEDGRLREEIALLDGVKAALQRGERELARQSLDTYRERFPEGILRREANVLRRRAEAKPGRASDGNSYED